MFLNLSMVRHLNELCARFDKNLACQGGSINFRSVGQFFFSKISVYWLCVEGRGMTWRYLKKCYLNLVLQKKSFKSLNAMRIRKVLHWILCFLPFQIDLKGLSFFQPYLSFCSSWQCASRPQKISSHQV